MEILCVGLLILLFVVFNLILTRKETKNNAKKDKEEEAAFNIKYQARIEEANKFIETHYPFYMHENIQRLLGGDWCTDDIYRSINIKNRLEKGEVITADDIVFFERFNKEYCESYYRKYRKISDDFERLNKESKLRTDNPYRTKEKYKVSYSTRQVIGVQAGVRRSEKVVDKKTAYSVDKDGYPRQCGYEDITIEILTIDILPSNNIPQKNMLLISDGQFFSDPDCGPNGNRYEFVMQIWEVLSVYHSQTDSRTDHLFRLGDRYIDVFFP